MSNFKKSMNHSCVAKGGVGVVVYECLNAEHSGTEGPMMMGQI